MHFDKLMEHISKIDIEYFAPLDSYINSFLQEIMDMDDYYDNGPKNISTTEILEDITNKVSEPTASVMLSCALEFCITNDYPLYGKTWNCIDYLLSKHKTWFTAVEKKYLGALNNSYMSIYKVISVQAGSSITLQCQIEKEAPKIVVIDKSLSNSNIKEGEYLAVRILKISSNKNNKYILSSSCFALPPHLIKECVSIIRNITDLMQNPSAQQLVGNTEIIENNEHNRLLAKKMWCKEILETWYLYYAHYNEHQEVLDSDGNAWHQCFIEFDLTVPSDKVRQALRFIPKFKFDEGCKDKNTWLWLNEVQVTSPINNSNNNDLYKDGNNGYSIFAGVKLSKDKLIVDVNSKQRANIAQDIMLTELGNMLSNPKIFSQS